MKLVIFRSRRTARGKPHGKYIQKLDTRFADRVLGNLRDEPGYCTACGPDCNGCRKRYARRFDTDLAGIIDLPHVLPYVLEKPATSVPRDVPRHDVLLAIAIHEQILVEIARLCRAWGTRGIVVPLEAPDWISGAARATVHRLCEEQGIEVSFPKPFCAFRPPRGGVLAAFREQFHIGCPDVKLTVEGGVITDADVRVSAACGATYCVGRWLVGRRMDENLEIEVISKQWHAFPCTASMERDPELHGETPLHMAGQAHYGILAAHKRVAGLESETVTSPLGTTVQKPIPPKENLQRIERAREGILARLRVNGKVSLRELRNLPEASPAAVNSAVLILKKEGLVRAEGTVLYPAADRPG